MLHRLRPTRIPVPSRLSAIAAVLLLVAACGQPAVATPIGGAGPATAQVSVSPATSAQSTSIPAGPPAEVSPSPIAAVGVASAGAFPGGFLIADRGNGRLLAIDRTGRIWWRFPTAGSLPPGQAFAADDAFIAPDGTHDRRQ